MEIENENNELNNIEKSEPNKKHRMKGLDYYFNHEMKYRGPLNIMKMRYVAWALMIITACAFGLNMFLNAKKIGNLDALYNILSIIGSLSISAFMVASFAYILQNKNGIGRVLLTYSMGAIGIIFAYYLFVFGYAASEISHVSKVDYITSIKKIDEVFTSFVGKGISFNAMIDLAMFSIFFFFLFYTPKKLFTKHILVFRLFAILPVAYVVFTFFWKALYAYGVMPLSMWFYPILPTKSPLMFISFCVVGLIVKIRQRKFLKGGRTEEDYETVFNSNGNSWLVSKSFALMFVVCGLIDLIITIIFVAIIKYNRGIQASCLDQDGYIIESMRDTYYAVSSTITSTRNCIISTKIGTAAGQIIFAPVVLLFSFNRKHVQSNMDIIVPLIGVGLMAFVVFNWIHIIIMCK